MDKMRIVGGKPLKGEIYISGAKNAALPLMCASLLTDEPLTLENTPLLADINSLLFLLDHHGVSHSLDKPSRLTLHAQTIKDTTAPYDIVRKMRASILVLGPLLARCHQAKVSLPGGCAIGTRPVDIHINGLITLGADISIEEGYIIANAPKGLIGAQITLPMPSVTGTENLMMAATLAKGQTVLTNAAREPEIIDLANCLNKMGAKISGAGTSTITIDCVDRLHGATHTVISDRIEAGTYIIAAAITRGEVLIKGFSLQNVPVFESCLTQAGVHLEQKGDDVFVSSAKNNLVSVDATTQPYPGFATDLQAQFMALMAISNGTSCITENIFENRFMHVPELQRLGADIQVQGSCAYVKGVSVLKGAPVMATDLRASVSLVLAGLAAQGETTVQRIYHLDRGYEKIEEKLRRCGANIERIISN